MGTVISCLVLNYKTLFIVKECKQLNLQFDHEHKTDPLPLPKGIIRSSLRKVPSALMKRSGRKFSGSPQYSGSM